MQLYNYANNSCLKFFILLLNCQVNNILTSFFIHQISITFNHHINNFYFESKYT